MCFHKFFSENVSWLRGNIFRELNRRTTASLLKKTLHRNLLENSCTFFAIFWSLLEHRQSKQHSTHKKSHLRFPKAIVHYQGQKPNAGLKGGSRNTGIHNSKTVISKVRRIFGKKFSVFLNVNLRSVFTNDSHFSKCMKTPGINCCFPTWGVWFVHLHKGKWMVRLCLKSRKVCEEKSQLTFGTYAEIWTYKLEHLFCLTIILKSFEKELRVAVGMMVFIEHTSRLHRDQKPFQIALQ